MKLFLIYTAILFAIGSCAFAQPPAIREWTSKKGNTTRGVLHRYDPSSGTVVLLIPRSIKLSVLSEEDQAYIKKHAKEAAVSAESAGNVKYSIISEDAIPGFKRSIDVRIMKPVSEDELRRIAVELKGREKQSFERTFIGFYLPDMDVDAVYWATTHYNPDLEVKILGFSPEEHQTLSAPVSNKEGRIVVGAWLDTTPLSGCKIVIFEQGGKQFIENEFKDGSKGDWEIVESIHNGQRRFDYSPDRGNGEFYIIDANGDLQQFGAEGVFMTAKKLRASTRP